MKQFEWVHLTNDFMNGLYKTKVKGGWIYCIANKPKWWKFWCHGNFAICFVPDKDAK